jgi:hypothetical protein
MLVRYMDSGTILCDRRFTARSSGRPYQHLFLWNGHKCAVVPPRITPYRTGLVRYLGLQKPCLMRTGHSSTILLPFPQILD